MLNRIINKIHLKLAKRDEYTSLFLRDYFRSEHEIDVGLYSYGCFDQARIGRNTHIGRYCSFAPTSYIFRRNHGINFLSSHPFLYNNSLNFPVISDIPFARCDISDDVWIGHLATILPSVRYIGRGAIIAAGSVVAKDIPAYSIVAGNPARIIKMRFTEDVIEIIEKTKWWELSKADLAEFCKKYNNAIFTPKNFIQYKNDNF